MNFSTKTTSENAELTSKRTASWTARLAGVLLAVAMLPVAGCAAGEDGIEEGDDVSSDVESEEEGEDWDENAQALEGEEDPEDTVESAVASGAMGIDTNGTTLDIGYARSRGTRFVGRYLSFDGTHPPINAEEAARFRAAKMPLFAIWQVTTTRSVETGSVKGQWAAGVADAQAANAKLNEIGAPGRPVYFTVDFNVTPKFWNSRVRDAASKKMIKQRQLVTAYFSGINSVLGVKRTGAYGTYTTVKGLFDSKRIAYGWQQTFGKRGYKLDRRAQLRQYNIYPSQTGWGVSGAGALDLDRATTPKFGQF